MTIQPISLFKFRANAISKRATNEALDISLLKSVSLRKGVNPSYMPSRICIQYYDSPCGELVLGAFGDAICLCDWTQSPRSERNRRRITRMLDAEIVECDCATLRQAASELDEYFAGKRKEFDLKLHLAGSEFQTSVWRALLAVSYGQIVSYSDIAAALGKCKGVRAAAQAIGANAISIIVPCHRIIAADGSLTGFAGGLEAKRFLLDLERR